MAEFTLVHRGVPIGTAAMNPFFERRTSGVPAPQPGEPIHLDFLDFWPLPAYEAIAPALQLARGAVNRHGSVGRSSRRARPTERDQAGFFVTGAANGQSSLRAPGEITAEHRVWRARVREVGSRLGVRVLQPPNSRR
jgi:hypothetical protein